MTQTEALVVLTTVASPDQAEAFVRLRADRPDGETSIGAA